MTLGDVLGEVDEQEPRGWLYLPRNAAWSLESPAAVFVSEEVLPESEDDADAGVPEAARQAGLMQVLPISVVQDVVTNLRAQIPSADKTMLLKALLHYYDFDAFIHV